MPSPKRIQSKDNPFFKALLKKDRGAVLLEGEHLAQSWWDRYGSGGILLLAASKEAEYAAYADKAEALWILEDRLMKALSSMPTPVGLMLKVPLPRAATHEPIQENCVMLDGVQDPGNVGTILRTAVAAGVGRVYLGRDCANPWSAKVLRSAQGAHFALDIAMVDDLAEYIQNASIPAVGTLLDASATPLYEAALNQPLIWVFGNEGQGVSPAVQAVLARRLYIPQASGVESLNVAIAAAICLFEQRRQQAYVH